MANIGEMAYSGKYNRLAFSYKLHPVIEVFGLDGSVRKKVEVAESTFNSATLENADFKDLYTLHFVDVVATDTLFFAL